MQFVQQIDIHDCDLFWIIGDKAVFSHFIQLS